MREKENEGSEVQEKRSFATTMSALQESLNRANKAIITGQGFTQKAAELLSKDEKKIKQDDELLPITGDNVILAQAVYMSQQGLCRALGEMAQFVDSGEAKQIIPEIPLQLQGFLEEEVKQDATVVMQNLHASLEEAGKATAEAVALGKEAGSLLNTEEKGEKVQDMLFADNLALTKSVLFNQWSLSTKLVEFCKSVDRIKSGGKSPENQSPSSSPPSSSPPGFAIPGGIPIMPSASFGIIPGAYGVPFAVTGYPPLDGGNGVMPTFYPALPSSAGGNLGQSVPIPVPQAMGGFHQGQQGGFVGLVNGGRGQSRPLKGAGRGQAIKLSPLIDQKFEDAPEQDTDNRREKDGGGRGL